MNCTIAIALQNKSVGDGGAQHIYWIIARRYLLIVKRITYCFAILLKYNSFLVIYYKYYRLLLMYIQERFIYIIRISTGGASFFTRRETSTHACALHLYNSYMYGLWTVRILLHAIFRVRSFPVRFFHVTLSNQKQLYRNLWTNVLNLVDRLNRLDSSAKD